MSPEYFTALEACKKHHAGSKTYSGLLMRPHTWAIKALIDRLCCTSVLDYGAGKGQQYEWVMESGQTIEQFWGVNVTKYDPAWPPFAEEPEGTFDLVICAHTLGAIPPQDRPEIIDRLFSLASKAVFIVEQIGRVKKKVLPHTQIPHTPDYWVDLIAPRSKVAVEAHLSLSYKTPAGPRIESIEL